MSAPALPPTPDTPITIKVIHDDSTRRFKVPLRDLTAHSLPKKLNQLLGVPSDANVIFERYSDSAGCYVKLDSANVAAYKQLYRAAKAKLKLRVKATTVNRPLPMSPVSQESTDPSTEHESPARNTYLETVLSQPLPEAKSETPPIATSVSTSSGSNNDVVKSSGNKPLQLPNADVAPAQPRYRDFMSGQDSFDLPFVSHQSPTGMFCIDCNHCSRSIPNEHYHCSICEDGDYDLCLQCVDSGVSCYGEEDHWLIKRFVDHGVVTNSTTETVAPQNIKSQETKEEEQPSELTAEPVPEKLSSETLAAPEPVDQCDERICNSCLKEFEETKMVTCTDCEDYDLCVTCLLHDTHGHHPGHAFSLIHERQFCLKSLVMARCSPGRHHHHAAICDGCEKRIIGVRHKCLACPDWDYCSDCVSNASKTHSGHRFAPIYGAITEPPHQQEIHYGIFCDGPLCKNKPSLNYITGDRFKCTVCHDMDLCANCEAVPSNTHNHTHPLVKFKTPVRGVTISTVNEDKPTDQAITLGDHVRKSTSTQASAPSEVAVTPVKVSEEKAPEELAASNPVEQTSSAPKAEQAKTPTVPVLDPVSTYQAFFVCDTVADGTEMSPNKVFRQTWTLFNPGPLAWPAGSDVRFVGGDTMFNVDTDRPSSLQSVASAMESNKLAAPVEPGHSADFTVLLRSPIREGSAISYWRLKLSNGMPFGHRLWCDIKVRANASENEPVEPVEKEVPEHDKQPEQPATGEDDQAESRMIFPTLDKESPEASTHQETAAAPSVPSVSNYTDQDYLTITDTVSMDDDETADGFLTDEEYDVLDASDHEYLEAKQSQ